MDKPEIAGTVVINNTKAAEAAPVISQSINAHTGQANIDSFDVWLKGLSSTFTSLSDEQRNVVLRELIDVSGPSQLLVLSRCIPQLVFRDFITSLPPEITLLILQHLDGKQLLLCCMVCKAWNKRISNIGGLWGDLAENAGANVEFYERRLKAVGTELLCDSSSLARLHKLLYLKAQTTLRGLASGRALHLRESFIDKGQWRITAVEYHNGCVVTGCDDHTVQAFGLPSGSPVYSVNTNSVCCLTIRDSTLYTASFNANAESWDLISGRHKRTFCGHTSAVVAIDVTPNRTFLLTGSVDKTAKLWDLRPVNTVLVRSFNSIHDDWVFQVKFLPSNVSEVLHFLTCDSNLCNLWVVGHDGDVLSSCHINSDGSSKFTSFYHLPSNPHTMFACQWEEWSKSSFLTKYTVVPKTCTIEKDYHISIPVEMMRAYILGAGRRFAVLMCSITRKDFHVMDLLTKTVVSKISTPDFCMLTRNGSTVCLCDTQWLDGLVFEELTRDRPIFAASVGYNTVLLGSWSSGFADKQSIMCDSEV